ESNNSRLKLKFHDPGKTQIVQPHESDHILPPRSIQGTIYNQIMGSYFGLIIVEQLVQSSHPELNEVYPWSHIISFMLCTTISLIVQRKYDAYDQYVRYKWYMICGYMSSCRSSSPHVDITIKQIPYEFEVQQNDYVHRKRYRKSKHDSIPREKRTSFIFKPTVCLASSNTSDCFKRLLPIVAFFYHYPPDAIKYAGESASILNNGDDRQIAACRYYAGLIVGVLHGYNKEQLLDTKFYDKHLLEWFNNQKLHKDVEKIANGDQCHHHYLQSLKLALEAFKNDENDIEQGYIQAKIIGGDDTAAVYVQLAGVLYGYANMPQKWKNINIYAQDFIKSLSGWLDCEGNQWFKIKQRFFKIPDRLSLSALEPKPIGDFIPPFNILNKKIFSYEINEERDPKLWCQINQWVGPLPKDFVVDKIEHPYDHSRYQHFLDEINKIELRQKQPAFKPDLVKIEKRLEERKRVLLQEESGFEPNLLQKTEKNLKELQSVLEHLNGLCGQLQHNRQVNIVRMWRGCLRKVLKSLMPTGSAANGVKDEDWFGKGIYFTSSAKYASTYGGPGECIILCYVLILNPLPIIDDDVPQYSNPKDSLFYALGNCENYHCHYIPKAVCNDENGFHDELVVFQEAYILPSIVVYFK
ncbi:unnamed protein product, partial [Didymodactylos carnosus]